MPSAKYLAEKAMRSSPKTLKPLLPVGNLPKSIILEKTVKQFNNLAPATLKIIHLRLFFPIFGSFKLTNMIPDEEKADHFLFFVDYAGGSDHWPHSHQSIPQFSQCCNANRTSTP
jgi:hypothetical protein